MKNQLIKSNGQDLISSLVLHGDISQMSADMKVKYYNQLCHSLNLNPVTKPFQIISFQGKTILYATKDATEQLRKLNGVSVVEMIQTIDNELIITKCKVQDKDGRYDIATGAVVLPKSALERANAIMKSETKAKRRATLSICGLGILDESELDTMPTYETSDISEIENKPDKSDEKKKYIAELQAAESMEELNKIVLKIPAQYHNEKFHEFVNGLKSKFIEPSDFLDESQEEPAQLTIPAEVVKESKAKAK